MKCFSLILLLIGSCRSSSRKKPNVIVLLADDLGIGDLSVYGNTTLPTPNIDRIFNEGSKFTHHMSTDAMCTPSRSAFLTGRYPIRYGMAATSKGPPVIVYTASKVGLPREEKTWANVAQDDGYATLAVGKWHMGWNGRVWGDQEHGPLTHGFDSFFGLPLTLVDDFKTNYPFWMFSDDNALKNNQAVAIFLSLLTVIAFYNKNYGYTIFVLMVFLFFLSWFFVEHFRLHTPTWWRRSPYMEKYLNSHLMSDNEVVEQPIILPFLTENLTNRTLAFIHENKDKPFLVYHAFTNVHRPNIVHPTFRGQSRQHGCYGDSVLEMDESVGRILRTLDELKLTENTIVFFASDHGSARGSNLMFEGGKGMGASEGGIRIPAGIRWPRKIRPGTVIDEPVSLLDFFPTLLEALGLENEKETDGISYFDSLIKDKEGFRKRMFRHYCGASLHALRYVDETGGVYKAVFRKRSTDHPDSFCDDVRLEKPEISEIGSSSLLSKDSEKYGNLLKIFSAEFSRAESEIHPEPMLPNYFDVLPLPWLQPCARFPFCKT